MRRYEITDDQWELILDIFPPLIGKGRPFRDHRNMVNACFWILNTGSPWRDLPERFGPWQTAFNRFNRWRKDGMFVRILERLQMHLDSEGRIDWDLWCVDGSNVRAHAAAAGAGKKGEPENPSITRWVAREAGLGPRSTWSLTVKDFPWSSTSLRAKPTNRRRSNRS
jgi:transposase